MYNREKMMARVQEVRGQIEAERQTPELIELCDVVTTTIYKGGLEYYILQAKCEKQPTVIIAMTALKPRTDKSINSHWVNKKLLETAQQQYSQLFSNGESTGNGIVNNNGTGIKQVSLSNTMELPRQHIHVTSRQNVEKLASNFSDISSKEILNALETDMSDNSPHPVLTK